MMNRHFQILESLLNFNQPLNELKKNLKTLPWDNENEIIVLKRIHVIKILERYINKELNSDEISEWANLIEGREDVGFEQNNEDVLKKVIFEMANPEINGPLTDYFAVKWISYLR